MSVLSQCLTHTNHSLVTVLIPVGGLLTQLRTFIIT